MTWYVWSMSDTEEKQGLEWPKSGQIPGSWELWVPFHFLWGSLSFLWEIWHRYNFSSHLFSLLQGSSVFLVPFDPMIPLFVFLIQLGIDTFRILKEDSLSSPSTSQSQESHCVFLYLAQDCSADSRQTSRVNPRTIMIPFIQKWCFKPSTTNTTTTTTNTSPTTPTITTTPTPTEGKTTTSYL